MTTSLIELVLRLIGLAVMVLILRELFLEARKREDQPVPTQSRRRRSPLGVIVIAASIGLIVLVNVIHDALVTSAAALVLVVLLLTFLRQSRDAISVVGWQSASVARQRLGYVLASVSLVGFAVYAFYLGTDVVERVLLLTPVVLGGLLGIVLVRRLRS